MFSLCCHCCCCPTFLARRKRLLMFLDLLENLPVVYPYFISTQSKSVLRLSKRTLELSGEFTSGSLWVSLVGSPIIHSSYKLDFTTLKPRLDTSNSDSSLITFYLPSLCPSLNSQLYISNIDKSTSGRNSSLH